MKKIFTLLAFIAFAGIFSACEEEEILPKDQLETEKGGGSAEDDPNQWG